MRLTYIIVLSLSSFFSHTYISIQDYEDGNTALHFAKQAEMDDAVDWLINVAQADDQIKNYQGHTCYFYGL